MLAASPGHLRQRGACRGNDLVEVVLDGALGQVEPRGDLRAAAAGTVQGKHIATTLRQRGGNLLRQPLQVCLVLAGNQLLLWAAIVRGDTLQGEAGRVDRNLEALEPAIASEDAMGRSANPDINLPSRRNPFRLVDEALAGRLNRFFDVLRRAIRMQQSKLSPQPCSPRALKQALEQRFGVLPGNIGGVSGVHRYYRALRSESGQYLRSLCLSHRCLRAL